MTERYLANVVKKGFCMEMGFYQKPEQKESQRKFFRQLPQP